MQYFLLNNFKSEKSEMNCDTSITRNKNAETILPSKYFKNHQVKKSKRYRSAFTTEQINYLETEFKKFPYIGSANRKEVANILKISERAIKIWFQNRRMKEKREVNSNKELQIEDKNIYNAFANKQLNNHNIYSHNDCGRNELLSSRCQNELLKEPNIETKKDYYILNDAATLTSQIKVKSVNNINISDKRNNRTLDMKKDFKNSNRFKYSLSSKVESDTKKIPMVTQRNKYIEQVSGVNKEFKNQVKIPIPSLNKKGSEVVQDLSLNNIATDQKQQQQFYPVPLNTDQRFVPFFTQGYYVPQPVAATQAMHSSNVIWKPVNVMPILPGFTPASTMGISHNNSGISLNNQDVSKGTCNCHGPPHLFNTRMQCVSRTQPQYILAIPFSNTSNKI